MADIRKINFTDSIKDALQGDARAFLSWGARIAGNTAINEFKRQNALKNSQIDYISLISESVSEAQAQEILDSYIYASFNMTMFDSYVPTSE